MLTKEDNLDMLRILRNEEVRVLELIQEEMVSQREYMDDAIAIYRNDIKIIKSLRDKIKEIVNDEP